VSFLAELASGTRLLLGTGAKVSVTYASTGTEYTVVGPGEFLVSAAEVKAEKGAAPTKRMVSSLQDAGVVARVSKTATASVRMRGVQQSGAVKAVLQYPVDTRVSSLQPAFRWQAKAVGGEAEVVLRDAKGKELWKGRAADGVRPAVKLAAATRYRWTLMTPKGAVGEAQFETLPQEAISRTAQSRANAKAFGDRVMHALLLHDVGATQEAHDAWVELARERPDLPELAALAK